MDFCIIGCGNQGGCFAALLAMEPGVGRIVLADLDIKKAENTRDHILGLSGRIDGIQIEVDTVNALDPDDVARAAAGTDFIFNGILPFCNLSVMKGALLANANYMDLYAMSADVPGTDYQESIEAQLELDEAFKKAGLIAFLSEGIAPGFVNLASRFITDQMDSVEEVGIRSITWMEAKELIAMGPAELSIQMTLHLEEPSYYKDGQIVPLDDVLPFNEVFAFPEPAGEKEIFMESVSCVEALIAKYTGKPVSRIYHRGAIFSGCSDIRDVIFRAVREQALLHPGTEEMNLIKLLSSSLKPMANADYKAMVESGELINGADTASVVILGTKNGRRVRHEISIISTLAEAVSHIPWVGNSAYSTVGSLPIILAEMLIKGEFNERGVIIPSHLPDPSVLFSKLERRGHKLIEKIEISTI